MRTASAYFEFPQERRQPLWRLATFVLAVLALHLLGLFLAFGTISRDTLPEALPVLTVRLLELAPQPPVVEAAKAPAAPAKVEPPRRAERPASVAPPEKVQRRRPARESPAVARRAPPTPSAPLLTAAATAPATTFAVAAAAAAPAAPAEEAAGSAASAPAAAPMIAARFDADYLRNPSPAYPAASRRLGEEGRVLLRIKVSAQGLPLRVEIKQSSGFQRLDDAARAAVERWRFVPARQGGEAVESSVLVPLQFKLTQNG